MVAHLFDFAMATIFAREFLEGSIIVGEYRTIIIRGGDGALAPGVTKQQALSEVTIATMGATALALLVIACVAIPLAILSSSFDENTGHIIEGVSKIVASISLLLLSLKLPKMLGIYASRKTQDETVVGSSGLTLRSIRFNVVWNIWREVAEVGAFLLPFFLSGDDLQKLPYLLLLVLPLVFCLVLGSTMRTKSSQSVTFVHFCGAVNRDTVCWVVHWGCHLLENAIRPTKQVWTIPGTFWDVHHFPMTILKPFGYNDSRTILEIVCFWSWYLLSAVLHFWKYQVTPKVSSTVNDTDLELEDEGSTSFPTIAETAVSSKGVEVTEV